MLPSLLGCVGNNTRIALSEIIHMKFIPVYLGTMHCMGPAFAVLNRAILVFFLSHIEAGNIGWPIKIYFLILIRIVIEFNPDVSDSRFEEFVYYSQFSQRL